MCKLPCLFVLLTAIVAYTGSGWCSGREELKINTSIKPPFSTAQKDGFFDLLIPELLGRAGVKVKLVRLPPERALQMANDGLSDGELPRIAGLEKKYPNLVQIAEPVIDYTFSAFSHKQDEPLSLCWKKLAGKSVGFIIGWKIYEKNVPATARVTKAKTPSQLFELLNSKRIEVALYERYAGKYIIKSNDYSNLEECKTPLAVRPMYLYMHNKHSDLSGLLSEELKKMKNDGSWQKIFSQTLEIE